MSSSPATSAPSGSLPRSPFHRIAGSLRKSRSSGSLKDASLTPAARGSPSPHQRLASRDSASPYKKPSTTTSKAKYAPARPSPLTASSTLLSFGSVSEAEADSVGTGYPWDPRPVTPKETSFSALQRVDVEVVGPSRTARKKMSRIGSASVSEFGEILDAVAGGAGRERIVGGTTSHKRSKSLFSLSRSGRSSPAPPSPSIAPGTLPHSDSTPTRKSSETTPSSRKSTDASQDGASKRSRTLSKARPASSRSSGSRPCTPKLQKPHLPSLPLSTMSQPTTPKSPNFPYFTKSPVPSHAESQSSPFTPTSTSSMASSAVSQAPYLPSVTSSKSVNSMSGALRSLRRKGSAVFRLGTANGSTPDLSLGRSARVGELPPRPSTSPRPSAESRPSTSPRPSTATESRPSITGAARLRSASVLSFSSHDPSKENEARPTRARTQSKSAGSLGRLRSLRRTTGRISSVGEVGSTPNLPELSPRKSEASASEYGPSNLERAPSIPRSSTLPRTSSQFDDRPRLTSPSQASLLLPVPSKNSLSPFRSLRKKTSQVFRSSPDLSSHNQHANVDQSPRHTHSKHDLSLKNRRASKSTASLSLPSEGFKLKLGSFVSTDKDGDRNGQGKDFDGFGQLEKSGTKLESYSKKAREEYANEKALDTKIDAEEEVQVRRGGGSAEGGKRKSRLGSVLIGLLKPLSTSRSESRSGGKKGRSNRGGVVFPEYSGIAIEVVTDRVVTSL